MELLEVENAEQRGEVRYSDDCGLRVGPARCELLAISARISTTEVPGHISKNVARVLLTLSLIVARPAQFAMAQVASTPYSDQVQRVIEFHRAEFSTGSERHWVAGSISHRGAEFGNRGAERGEPRPSSRVSGASKFRLSDPPTGVGRAGSFVD